MSRARPTVREFGDATSAHPRPILCFGEVLWDALPRGLFPGGAPINVAFHLAQLGDRAVPVTAVGDDELGRELTRRMRSWRLPTEHVAVDSTRPTGMVRADIDDTGNATYTILDNAAWDRIPVSKELEDLAGKGAGIVFGSLAMRSGENRAAIERLLDHIRHSEGSIVCFDVNLRPPHYTPELIRRLAPRSDVMKLNEEEADILLGGRLSDIDLEAKARLLGEQFGPSIICITAGSQGAGLLHASRWYREDARAVDVIDTVGAGDAFLAGLVHALLERPDNPSRALRLACRLGEFVAGAESATPSYPEYLLASLPAQ